MRQKDQEIFIFPSDPATVANVEADPGCLDVEAQIINPSQG